jgi:hypothetical protein
MGATAQMMVVEAAAMTSLMKAASLLTSNLLMRNLLVQTLLPH